MLSAFEIVHRLIQLCDYDYDYVDEQVGWRVRVYAPVTEIGIQCDRSANIIWRGKSSSFHQTCQPVKI